jgi:hypothetical protein
MEIQSGAVAKSYMRKGFLIYEGMRKHFSIYCMRRPFLYEENLIFFFISVYTDPLMSLKIKKKMPVSCPQATAW